MDKPGIDKPTGRVVALIVLLIAVAAALRGYLPPPHHGPRAEAGGGRTALTFIVVALAVTLALLAVAIIARLRDPRAEAPHAGELSDMLGTGKSRPNWRVVLIGLALIVAWIVVVLLLSRLIGGHDVAAPPPTQDAPAPPSTHTSGQPPQQRPRHDSGDMFAILLASTALMSLLTVAGAVAMARRRWRAAKPAQPAKPATDVDDDKESPAAGTPSQSLVRAAERGLAEMTDLSRDPREAIIACYAAMERELANVPEAVPQDFDTPTEVLARAVEHHALQSDNAGQLVTLFAEARFSPHVMNEGHRDVAVRVLRMVLDELRSRSAA